MSQLKIVKVDEDEKKTSPQVVAGVRKTLKTFPRGILKTKLILKPTADPAKPPPIKKSMKKHTIRLLTDKGARHHRKTIKRRVRNMSDEKVKSVVLKSGILKNINTPISIMREMLEGGMIAGFISEY